MNLDENNTPRILIVDDLESTRKVVSKFLTLNGYECDEASGIRDLVHVVKRFDPEVIVLDINMPLYDGADIGKVLIDKEAFRVTPIIYYTGMKRDAVDLEMRPIDHFVPKGEDLAPLLEAVNQCFSR